MKWDSLPDELTPNPFIDEGIYVWREGFMKGRQFELTTGNPSAHYNSGYSKGITEENRKTNRRLKDQRRELGRDHSVEIKELKKIHSALVKSLTSKINFLEKANGLKTRRRVKLRR